MKYKIFLSIIIFFLSLNSKAAEPEVLINFRVKGVQDTSCILAYRFGKKVFVKDTINVDKKGLGQISYDKALASGAF